MAPTVDSPQIIVIYGGCCDDSVVTDGGCCDDNNKTDGGGCDYSVVRDGGCCGDSVMTDGSTQFTEFYSIIICSATVATGSTPQDRVANVIATFGSK